MSFRDTLQHAWRALVPRLDANPDSPRKTAPLPALLTPYGRHSAVASVPKPTPENLRRFAETPVARRALNLVKDKVSSMDWQIRIRRGYNLADVPDAEARMAALRRALEEPNAQDSFRTLFEQVLEDVLVGGFGAVEMRATGDPAQPFELYPVDGARVQIDPRWTGDPDQPRFGFLNSAAGLLQANTVTPLADSELMYIRLNPRTHTPFGLGRLEVAFETIGQFLGANRYAGRLASNSVVQYALWLGDASPSSTTG